MAKNPKTSNESVSTSARTSEENDAIRRQKKAAQRKGSGKGGQQTTLKGTFFGDLMDEKATKREERARMLALKRERQMEYVGPRELAIKATDAPGLIGLDGLVLTMVVATIEFLCALTREAPWNPRPFSPPSTPSAFLCALTREAPWNLPLEIWPSTSGDGRVLHAPRDRLRQDPLSAPTLVRLT